MQEGDAGDFFRFGPLKISCQGPAIPGTVRLWGVVSPCSVFKHHSGPGADAQGVLPLATPLHEAQGDQGGSP